MIQFQKLAAQCEKCRVQIKSYARNVRWCDACRSVEYAKSQAHGREIRERRKRRTA
jgi:Zn finger protein HypA/HybF involved in hydrogenase expression